MPYYHASPAKLAVGDLVEVGHPANFADKPMAYVFLSDNLVAAEFWQEFLGGESMAESLGYWPEVFIYEVEPTGAIEPDPWCEYHDIQGCYRSESPLRVANDGIAG